MAGPFLVALLLIVEFGFVQSRTDALRLPVCRVGDQNAACSYWGSLGYCHANRRYNWRYVDRIRKTCPATCGVCQARPTPKPFAGSVRVNVQDCLRAHNRARAKHGVPRLRWDATLARSARAWATELANDNKFEHSSVNWGENMYTVHNSWGRVKTCRDAVERWYAEVKYYPFYRPPSSIHRVIRQIGHFTQLIWKSTTKVGVGIAKIKRGFYTKTYIVAHYDPPGNSNRQFAVNVPPARYN